MSMMIVNVTPATALSQNKSGIDTLRSRVIRNFHHTRRLNRTATRSRSTTTTSTTTTTSRTTTSTPTTITTASPTTYFTITTTTPLGVANWPVLKDYNLATATTSITPIKSLPLKTPKYKKIKILKAMREKMQEKAKQKQQQQQELHAMAGETDYLLERMNDSMHEQQQQFMQQQQQQQQQQQLQPIYGTWRTKARRPSQSALIALATTSVVVAAANDAADAVRDNTTKNNATINIAEQAATSIVATFAPLRMMVVDGANNDHKTATAVDDDRDVNNNSNHNHMAEEYQNHLYERLPRRSSTMTPIKSEFLNDQIPRPPRLISRQSSLLARRQYLDTPGIGNATALRGLEDERPKPFHFPHEGPLPEEFRKVEDERNAVNNIQDILQQLHLTSTSSTLPPMLMMPTGLHIAGSFKNLKSSGIMNFFRNKRNKKPLQMTFPVPIPMQMFSAYQTPVFNGMGMQPFQQRIALDQFYPFKPRSPNDINLLAMNQAQYKANRSKNKKKQKKALTHNPNNLLLQHSNHYMHGFPVDPALLPNYSQLLALMNNTQKQKIKRVPFKVNLDIFPVLPPSKDFKAPTAFAGEETKHTPFSRPHSVMRNPFTDIYSFPQIPSAAMLGYANQPHNEPLYGPFKFPSAPMQMPKASNAQIRFPEPVAKQHSFLQPKPQYMNPLSHHQHQQSSFLPIDAVQQPTSSSKSNQVMVHLNVFPKQKPAPAFLPTLNPFYSNAYHINRHAIAEETEPLPPVEPRNQPYKNNNKVSNFNFMPLPNDRSDDWINLQTSPFDNLEHNPVAAAEYQPHQPELPQPAALVSNKLDTANASHYDHIELRNNHNFNLNPNHQMNVEQVASESQAAKLFRFPVEDLIQFQVDDAL